MRTCREPLLHIDQLANDYIESELCPYEEKDEELIVRGEVR